MSPEIRVRRAWAVAAAAALLLVGAIGTFEATRWLGRPFPGFLVLENRVVASVALSHWPATAGGGIFQHEVRAVDGRPLASAGELHQRVRSAAPGTPFVYAFRGRDRSFERTIPSRTFAVRDFLLLFGVYLLNGAAMGGTALVLLLHGSTAARSAVPMLLVGGLWGLSALDLYGPYRLFRLHALFEALLFSAAFHMALGFPRPFVRTRRAGLVVGLPYAAAAGFALVYQLGLRTPAAYVSSHLLATTALGGALLVLLAALAVRYVFPPSQQARHQIRALALGALLAVALPICLTVGEIHTGGRMPQNAVGFTAFLLPIMVGYAVRYESGRLSRSPG